MKLLLKTVGCRFDKTFQRDVGFEDAVARHLSQGNGIGAVVVAAIEGYDQRSSERARAIAALDGEAAVFHDCHDSEIIVRQLRNRQESDLAAFGLMIEALGFDGGFLSLSVRLPAEAVAGLGHRHLIRVDLNADCERPQKALVWLNIEHGPNTDRAAFELRLDSGERMAEFDLAHVAFDERRVGKMWVDVFFDDPRMNRVVLRDLTFSRRPRAEL